MFKNIRSKFIIIIIPCILFTMMLTYIFCTRITKNIMLDHIKSRIQAEQTAHAYMIEDKLREAVYLAETISMYVEMTYKTTDVDNYKNELTDIVRNQQFLMGSGIWFEPNVFFKEEKYVGPYIYKQDNKIHYTEIYEGEEYDYLNQEFYLLPKDTKKTSFTKAYYDQNLGTYIITCASPIVDNSNNYLGCCTVDIELSSMQELVLNYNKEHTFELSVINIDGSYMASADETLIKNNRKIFDSKESDFYNVAQTIMKTQKGIQEYTVGADTTFLYYNTIEPMDWKIVYEITESDINKPLEALNRAFLIISFVAMILIVVIIIMITNHNIIYPLTVLDEDLSKFDEFSFERGMPSVLEKRRDEFGRIGRTLSHMKSRLVENKEDMNASMEELIASEEEIQNQNEQLKQKENELYKAYLYRTAIIEAIPDIVLVISGEGIFVDCQGNTSGLYMPKELFIGKHIDDILPAEIASEGMKNIKDVIETGIPKVMEYELANDNTSGCFEMRIARCEENTAVGIIRNITEENKKAKEIEYLSFHDQVTGLFNRRYFEQVLEELPSTDGYPVGIVMGDVNGLKLMNDSFGHDAGDELLIKLSNVLKKNTDSSGYVFRIGGDEFVILLLRSDLKYMKKYIDKIETAIIEESVAGIRLSVSFGMGIANDRENNIRQVLKVAEDRMYQKKLFEAYSRQSNMIEVIMKTLQEKNPREEQHSQRVAEICERLAVHMGMDHSAVKRIRHAALLHDIGKIGIPENLLNKEGALTQEEYIAICKHPEIGHRILQSVSQTAEISEIVLYHHEKWNGTGYPKGLKTDEIPIESRIISIADAFDAMTSDRSYRKGMSAYLAFEELERCSGTQFDPSIVNGIRDLLLKNDVKE